MKGRPVDPTRARRGTGNRPAQPKARKVVAIVPKVSPLEHAPDGLPERAREIWDLVVADLDPKFVRGADAEALRMMCIQAARARDAAENIAKYGMLVSGARGPMVNPMIKAERDATTTYLRLAEQYGLTISSRLRLGIMQLVGETMLSSLNSELDV